MVRWLQKHGAYVYLFAMATLPELQGKGLGGQLMRFITDRADALGLPTYLEVHKILLLPSTDISVTFAHLWACYLLGRSDNHLSQTCLVLLQYACLRVHIYMAAAP